MVAAPLITLIASVSLAQPAPDYGLTWRTIGDPGNPAAQPQDYMWLDRPIGRVDYEYRLTQTEVTYTQWIEFADALVRADPSVNPNSIVLGRDLYHASNGPGDHQWYTAPGAENAAVQTGWLYAARYTNWLHNGKRSDLAAFQSGVYDISSFRLVPGNPPTWVGNSQRSPDALFWIPSWSELVKGLHWDPNKSGPGQGGYWLYPHSSDTQPIGGLPGTPGAQSSAGNYPNAPFYVPVGSYPNAVSPWGLLDGSGGAPEYLGEWIDGVLAMDGSMTGEHSFTSDRLDYATGVGLPDIPIAGIRLASRVPGPGGTIFALASFMLATRRRRS